MEPFINCTIVKLQLVLFLVSNMSLVAIAVDRLIAIVYIKTFPFKYRKIMTPRVVAVDVTGTWLLALLPIIYGKFTDADGYIAISEYGACTAIGDAFLEVILLLLLPTTTLPIVTVVLNILFAFKTYQVHKQLVREIGVDAESEKVKALKKVQCKIRRNMKPVITLLAVVWSYLFLNIVFAVVYILGRFVIDSQVYLEYMDYIVLPNLTYVLHFTNAIAYGLYFKQVREPIMGCWKRFVTMKKVNSVAPQPPRMARM